MFRRPSIVSACAATLAITIVLMPKVSSADPAPTGATAPNFTLPSQENQPVSLTDYKGKWVVLYFYPKDQSTGCTLEAHNFQRDLAKYEASNTVVLGVSLDTVESHKAFCTKDSLSFKLLADPDHEAIDAYGVPIRSFGPMHVAERTTFLISPQGIVVKVWTVRNIASHSADVLAEIDSMTK